MFTNLTPSYQFTDGTGFIVDEWAVIEEGDKVKLYIPSMMSEITRSETSEENIEAVSSPYELFLNTGSCPNIPGTVTSLNYVTGEIIHDLVISKANEELYKKYKENPKNTKPITHIPMKSKLSPGDQVTVYSNTGTIKDLFIS